METFDLYKLWYSNMFMGWRECLGFKIKVPKKPPQEMPLCQVPYRTSALFSQKPLLEKTLVPITDKKGKLLMTDWLSAREATNKFGGLPPHYLLNDYFVFSDKCKSIHILSLWAREVLVYPAIGQNFIEGQDLVDSVKDAKDRIWCLPASLIPPEVFELQKQGINVGLFIDPEDVDVSNWRKKVAILAKPKSIVILRNFLQESAWGMVEPVTGIPLEVPKGVWDALPEDQRRWLYRINGAGVRPLARGDYRGGDHRDVVAVSRQNIGRGVAKVELRKVA